MEKTSRLYFIDAMRAWAILMMLQGHFTDGLLDPLFRDTSNAFFAVWKYNRGITAPTFFTVAGFIFMYLLIRQKELTGWANPRVMKGIKRGLMLIGLGYILRLNFKGFLFKGEIYDNFYRVDVLHCIGLSILFLVGIYLLTHKARRFVMPLVLAGSTLLLFSLFPWYSAWDYSFFPKLIANYFTMANGSVFTIVPWLGYAAFGAFMSVLFSQYREKKNLYPVAIRTCLVAGSALIFFCSPAYLNNALFARLGNVLILFTVFMLIRNILTSRTVISIGQNTLSIYVIHYIILYGSFFGLGLYQPFHHSLNPYIVIPGAVLFMATVTWLSFLYNKIKPAIREKKTILKKEIVSGFYQSYRETTSFFAKLKVKILSALSMIKS
ncbi:heparan-alpha-glucosaminide N-acetyltransferase domain-containing protein [Sinomicrobium sp. M5D2P9]